VLHEVGNLDLPAQDRLLEVIRSKRLWPIGGPCGRAIDVRIVATTSRDVKADVERGRFRLPLLYSLSAISVKTLPLRERPADIAPLARCIIARLTLELGVEQRWLTAAALALLQAYDWPGNVGQLKRVLEKAVANSTGDILGLEDFAEVFEAIQPSPPRLSSPKGCVAERVNALETIRRRPTPIASWPTLSEVEREHLRVTLNAAGQNLALAARLLDLDAAELHEKLLRHRLPGPVPVPRRSGIVNDRSA
jgi:DNA-binding NtrC family response regulator